MFSIQENSWYSVKDTLEFNELFDNKTIRTNKQVTYFNDILAFDIETSSFTEEPEEDYRDVELYKYLKGTKIKVSQQTYKDIPDFNSIRMSLFGRLYFSKSDGIRIDSLYNELMGLYPYYFDEDIINPSDQLERIIEVFEENKPVEEEEPEHKAIMYIWQLAINGRVIIGRTWEEFSLLLHQISSHYDLNPDRRMVIWVHNLSFEFQFMKDLFEWEKVFAISTRKPIYALTKSGIEFRCSYILSNLSLENLGETLTKYKVSKLVGSLDYDLVRHHETPLTDKELQYCINDVLVVSAYIKELIEKEGDISQLPLTATGYCRNFVRKNCLVGDDKQKQFTKYHEMIRSLKISGVAEYELMNRAFSGGFTHCSTRFACKTLTSVDSFDFTSSYPYVLCSEQFPMSKGEKVKVKNVKELKQYCKMYCCIFDIMFDGIKPKYLNENYISVSKCMNKDFKPLTDKQKKELGFVTNNGRLVSSEGKFVLTLTNIDFDIISKVYKLGKVYIGDFYIYKRDYLPKEVIMSILTLYKDKTELKGVEGKEDFYTKGKQLLNSIYGMMVTSIIMPIHKYDNNKGWFIEKKEAEKELKRYNNSKKRFLFYAWGVFCTAYARKNLWSGILAFGDDYIYSDTDSIKAVNADKHMDYINAYNKQVERKLKRVSDHYNIPIDYFRPKTIKGVEKILGVWDKETDQKWKMFKSLGAKRYMILTADDKLTITVSGVNKKTAVPYIIYKYGIKGAFEHFNDELKIPAEYKDKEGKIKAGTGKLTHYYLDDLMQGEVTDYLGNTVPYVSYSGIYLEKTSYNFSMEKDYLLYLKELRGEVF